MAQSTLILVPETSGHCQTSPPRQPGSPRRIDGALPSAAPWRWQPRPQAFRGNVRHLALPRRPSSLWGLAFSTVRGRESVTCVRWRSTHRAAVSCVSSCRVAPPSRTYPALGSTRYQLAGSSSYSRHSRWPYATTAASFLLQRSFLQRSFPVVVRSDIPSPVPSQSGALTANWVPASTEAG